MKLRTVLGLAALLPVVGYVAVAAVKGRDAVWSTLLGEPAHAAVDFGAWTREPTGTEYILCPEDLCPGPVSARPPVFDVPVDDLRRAFDAMLAADPDVRRLSWDDALQQGEWEARTPLLRFPDRVTVRFLPRGAERSTLAVFSRSGYGRHDFGTNGRRVTGWMDALRREVGS